MGRCCPSRARKALVLCLLLALSPWLVGCGGGGGGDDGSDDGGPPAELDAAAGPADSSTVAPPACRDGGCTLPPAPDASAQPPAGLDAGGPARPDASDCPPDPISLTLDTLVVNTTHKLLAVDHLGTAFGLLRGGDESQLWASLDGGRNWLPRAFFGGHDFFKMTCLSDGVLVADTTRDGGHVLARSTDHGFTWSEVLPLGDRRMLQPASVVDLGGEVFFAEYQAVTQDLVPIRLWASADRGATWSVRHTFEGFRHAHALLADAGTGALWAFMGDPTGGTLRSLDHGATWTMIIPGAPGVVVDAVALPGGGLLFGTDGLYRPAWPFIERFLPDQPLQFLLPLPGPSYSIHAVRQGGFLIGTTRENGGDVYPPGDDSAHLFASVDGQRWTELLALPRVDPAVYGRIDVYWDLPDGSVFVEVANAQGYGHDGNAFFLARPIFR